MLDTNDIIKDLDNFTICHSSTCDIEDCPNIISKPVHTIKILHQNIRSVNKNFPSLLTLLERSNTDWDFIILTECWLQNNPSIPSLDGYSYIKTNRNKTQNEGVIIFYKNNSTLSISISEPNLSDANGLTIKIDSSTLLLAIYRPPGYKNVNPFFESLNDLLSSSNVSNTILIGDINIDILDHNTDINSPTYLNLLASHSILPAHLLPTHGKTCLDHVMVKTKLPASCYVAQTSVTDHDSLIFILERELNHMKPLSTVTKIDYEGLDKDMESLNFDSLYDNSDPNVAATLLISKLSSKIKSNTKTISVPNRKRITKPWITLGLLRCMRNRDNLHKKTKKNPNNDVISTTYKRYRNFCNELIKKVKNEYEKKLVQNASKTSNKMLWDTIKRIAHSNSKLNPASELISPSEPIASVNKINNFFASIGKNLADKISPPLSKVTPKRTSPFSFALTPTDEVEVRKCILNLKKNNTIGRDNISGDFLKRFQSILIKPITFLVNLIFSTGIFPTAFKLAEVIPIYKSGDRDSVNNYRPISILSTLSKIVEKLLNKRLVSYLESKHLLSSSQFGFRSGVSTKEAVHELTEHIVSKLDSKKKVIAIFLDLAKAFDSVSVPLLLDKLESIGVRDTQLNLFNDYLTNRKQRVRVGDFTSDDLPITYGVPQGSVLGPTLFLIFINDLCDTRLANGKLITFADDTALIFHGDTWEEAFGFAQLGFDEVYSWLRNNRLSLNVDKTKFMPFSLRSIPSGIFDNYSIRAHSCYSTFPCSCSHLSLSLNIKYLGVIIDNTLRFNLHLDLISSRTRKLIYIFKNLRHVADKNIIKMVYIALCQSIISYCITVWGGTNKTNLLKLERAQRSVLKVSLSLPFLFPTQQLYPLADVLSVRQLFILNTILKQHSLISYDPALFASKRRNYKVCNSRTTWSTDFSHRFFGFLGEYLYNRINKKIEIYSLTKYECKRVLTAWLKSLSYEDTESLLSIIS